MKAVFRELGASGVLIVCAVAVLLPVGGLMALDAFGAFDIGDDHRAASERHAAPPAWMKPLSFVAQTGDGFPVTLEVAIDAPDRAVLNQLSGDTAQLVLMLKLQVGTMLSGELKRPGGIEQLSERMLGAVRERVGDDEEDDEVRVRRVAIGNLVVRTP